MADYPEKALRELCKQLNMDAVVFTQCIQESVVEIHEIEGRLDLSNGTALRMRRLERICQTFDVDVHVALLLLDLVQRIAHLQEEVEMLRASSVFRHDKNKSGTS